MPACGGASGNSISDWSACKGCLPQRRSSCPDTEAMLPFGMPRIERLLTTVADVRASPSSARDQSGPAFECQRQVCSVSSRSRPRRQLTVSATSRDLVRGPEANRTTAARSIEVAVPTLQRHSLPGSRRHKAAPPPPRVDEARCLLAVRASPANARPNLLCVAAHGKRVGRGVRSFPSRRPVRHGRASRNPW